MSPELKWKWIGGRASSICKYLQIINSILISSWLQNHSFWGPLIHFQLMPGVPVHKKGKRRKWIKLKYFIRSQQVKVWPTPSFSDNLCQLILERVQIKGLQVFTHCQLCTLAIISVTTWGSVTQFSKTKMKICRLAQAFWFSVFGFFVC